MEMTMFLAGLWGPAILAMGVGVFMNQGHYARIYREIQREPFALLAFGIAGIMLGLWHVQAHNIWETPVEMIVSLFGWGLLAKALVFVVKPDIVDSWGNWVAGSKMIPTVGVLTIALGGYLTWVAYFA
jgi:hypothetical protein